MKNLNKQTVYPRPTSGPNISVGDCLDFHTSRYREEFTEANRLGKGAYGHVYRVKRHIL